MPCETVTIPAPTPSFTSPTIQNTSTSTGQAQVTYNLSNQGEGRGSARINVTVDVANDGSVDESETIQHTLDPGESRTNTVTFNFPNIVVDTQAKICVTLD